MTHEELVKALGEALAPVNTRLDELEKATKGEDPKEADKKKKKEDEKDEKETPLDAKAVAKAVAESIAPLNEKIEKLEKARFSNVTEQNYTETVEKSEVPSYVDAAFPMSE